VALVKNEHHLLVVDRQVSFALHQVIELLNGGDDDLVVVFVDIAFKARRAFRAIDAVRGKTLVFLHGLVIQILPVHHEKHLVDKVQFGGEAGGLKAGQSFAGTGGVPDVAATFRLAPVFALPGAVDLPQNPFRGRNLVGPHDQQGVAGIKYRVAQQDTEQGVFLEKGGGKVLQVLNQAVIRLRPVHGEVEAVFVALGGVGKVTAVRAVGNHKQLQVLEQGMLPVKAFLAVAMHLIEGLPNCHPPPFQFHLHQGQAIDQHGHIVAIGLAARLFKLVDHLHPVAGKVILVHQGNVLDMAIVKDKVIDPVVVDFAGFFHHAVAGLIQPGFHKALPFPLRKLHMV